MVFLKACTIADGHTLTRGVDYLDFSTNRVGSFSGTWHRVHVPRHPALRPCLPPSVESTLIAT
jgi:hypothetical protein